MRIPLRRIRVSVVQANDLERLLRLGLLNLQWYGRQAGRTFSEAGEAYAHFDAEGWRAGLSPSPLFDVRFYLKRNADVREAGENPLTHYLQRGRREGRRPRIGRAPIGERPAAPPLSRWPELAAVHRLPPPDEDECVDVVVPVYRGFADTLACLESVLASRNETPFRLVVIEDASPDAPLVEKLRELAALGLLELLSNPENLGFVETANRGFSLSGRRDVLLLNSDTVVHGDWLDRVRAHARVNKKVASVTPMSNNATILSYPYAPGNNNQTLEIADAELDAVFAAENRGLSADIPTGVGFCFYVPRAALQELGAFDPAFSPGYGEENDFCRRAAARGWRNLAALDVFVRHTGESSFADPVGRKAAATERVVARYPDYLAQIDAFVAADPLRPARQRVDLVRASRLSAGRGVLMVEHGWGGGVERHIVELAGFLQQEQVTAFRLAPREDGRLLLDAIGDHDLPNLPRLAPDDPEEMAAVLSTLAIGHVHIHSLVSWPLASFAPLLRSIGQAELAYDFTWHDYAPACPRITMVDWGGIYCARPSTSYCRTCIDKAGTRFGPVDIDAWRSAYAEVLNGARRVFAPDQDVADRVARYGPGEVQVLVRPHPLPVQATRPLPRPAENPVRTVGVLGRIGPFKGSSVLLRLAGDALERGLPLRFRLHGATTRAELKQFPNVEFAGEYLEDELEDQLAADPPHLLFFPSVWPETFSYTLDVALRTGLHPVCFDIGAPARRLSELGLGTVLPLDLALRPAELNDRVLSIQLDGGTGQALEEGRDWASADAYYARLPRSAP